MTNGGKFARQWFLLAVAALAASGFYSILLVLARSPGVSAVLPGRDFFHVALVVHVNLSVLIWLLSMTAALWHVMGKPLSSALSQAAFWMALLGAVVVGIAPFIGGGEPIMNNYVPMLDSPVFALGIALFLGAMAAQALCFITASGGGTAVMVITAAVSFALSLKGGEEAFGRQERYEAIFWGGGHILQFAYASLAAICWFLLAAEMGARFSERERKLVKLFLAAAAACAVLGGVIAHISYRPGSPEYAAFMTELMRWGNGIAALPIGLMAALRLKEINWRSPLGACVVASLALFCYGGVLGYLISGSNVTIPAHYHGSIVGVTIAAMGLAYWMMPKIGFAEARGKMAVIQPYLYGFGQMVHITGLAVSGGYGALRKTPGTEGLAMQAKIMMGVMGTGGLLAVIGGLMFVVVVVRGITRNSELGTRN